MAKMIFPQPTALKVDPPKVDEPKATPPVSEPTPTAPGTDTPTEQPVKQ